LKRCAACGALLGDEDDRCGVCGTLYSETEEPRIEANPGDIDVFTPAQWAKIRFTTGVASIAFGIITIVGGGFGIVIVPLFLIGLLAIPFGLWMLAKAVLGGLGIGTRGYGLSWFRRETEIREEEKHEDPNVREERREEDYD